MRIRLPHWISPLFVIAVFWLVQTTFGSAGRLHAAPSEAAPSPVAPYLAAPSPGGATTAGATKAPPPKPAPPSATPAPSSPSPGAAPAAAGSAAKAPKPPESKAKPSTPARAGAPAGGRAAGSGPLGKTPDETHVLKLRDLESRIDELKEQIRRSHARLSLLSETLLSGGLGGARADLVFRNKMSNAFRIRRILVVLDGAVQYKKQDETDELSNQKEIPVFTGPIPPGDHTLQVIVGMQGHGYGIFSYLRAFKPEVKHTRSFTVEEGKAIRIEITAWEKGSATTPLEDRPALRLTEKLMDRREAELDDGAE